MFTLLGMCAGMSVILILFPKFYLISKGLDISRHRMCNIHWYLCMALSIYVPTCDLLAIVCLGEDYKYK